uniref:hypothetical protein n=1 Tax=Flavobacterium sp. TaxID=239 RepID=UPI00404AA795
METKTVEINKNYIFTLLLSLILGFIILYGIEHLGKFSYLSSSEPTYSNGKPTLTSSVSGNTKVSKIYYYSFFDTKVETSGNGFDLYDINYSNTDFDKYSVKSYYYTKATIEDYKYGIYISLGLFLILIFFRKFKIKLI